MFLPQMRPAPKSNCFVCVDPTDPGEARSEVPIPVGTQFIWDTCSIQTGYHRPVKGRYVRLLVPRHLPDPELPPGADPNEFKPITVSFVWLDSFGDHPAALREFVLANTLAPNALARLYRDLSFHAEMQRGLIPVLEILECQPYENGYGRFGIPRVKLIGWVERDADLFGPIITPPPSPILSGPPPTPQIMPPKAPPAAATPEPANDPSPEPVNDPLARFRPSGKKAF
jgi:hypothetical protein